MRLSTALNHQRNFLGILREIYSVARISGATHDAILYELDNRLHKAEAWERVPQWVRSHVGGYYARLREEIYERHLVFRHFFEGRYVDAKDIPSGRLKDAPGCHFWRDNGKPFGNAAIAEKEKVQA